MQADNVPIWNKEKMHTVVSEDITKGRERRAGCACGVEGYHVARSQRRCRSQEWGSILAMGPRIGRAFADGESDPWGRGTIRRTHCTCEAAQNAPNASSRDV